MVSNADASDLSELERELELEMEEPMDSSGELDEEFEGPADEGEGAEEELEMEHEGSDYAERLSNLASREFESETEVDQALNEVLNDIEQEFFWGAIKRGWKKLKKGGLGNLVKKGLSLAAGQIPALQALKGITSLARGDLKGFVGSLAKSAIGAAVPGGGLALGALKNLGFGESELAEDDREAWNNVVTVAREAYDHLARNLNERADDPVEAARLASDAFKTGLAQVTNGVPRLRARGRRRRRIRLRRGDILIIECD
jgi:hypothetical protein